ncbi:MAG: tRNA preQ1(34) S-adenosylmethionine ribosyltransferase-isomerase QueA [Chloroflexota bacterium]
MNVSQFDYELPPERIAQTPVEPRDTSRLMVVDRKSGEISHHIFSDILNFLNPGDILIANNSRVIPARLFGHKPTGGKAEILLLKQRDPLQWEALVGGKRLRPGISITLDSVTSDLPSTGVAQSSISLTILEDLGQARRLIQFDQPITPHLERVGQMPLPPYIHTTLSDQERYQTVFSRIDGSAAAPTAGLHFTPDILLALRNQGVGLDYVTLHIGLDTFKPVTVDEVEQHPIHTETARLTAETAQAINQAKLKSKRLIAVGTTAVRTLETAALRSSGLTGSLQMVSNLDPQACPWKSVVAIEEETDLFIYPGYTFRAVDVMLTNFHLPKSTLLMLVSAFAGQDLMREAYETAIAEAYRFYSFGDAMLIL